MGKKTKIASAVLLASALGLVIAWFSWPALRSRGYQAVLQFGPESLRHWSINQLRELKGHGSEALGLFVLEEVEDKELRLEVLVFLANLSKEAQPAAPALIETLKDEDDLMRSHAAFALTMIGDPCPEVVEVLIQVLQHGAWDYRTGAAKALGLRGRKSVSAIPALTRALNDKHRNVRGMAKKALDQIRNAP